MNDSEPVVDASMAEVVMDSSMVEVVMDSSMVEVVMDGSMVEVVMDGSMVEVVMDGSMVEVDASMAVVDLCMIGVVNMDMMEIPTCCHESWALLTEYMKSHEINNLYSIFSTKPHLIQANILYTLLQTRNIYKVLVVDHDIGYITDMFLHNKPDVMVLAYSEEPVPYRNIVADYLKNKYEPRYHHINSVNNGHVNISGEEGYSPLFDQVDLIFINGENDSSAYLKQMIESCRSMAHANTILAFSYTLPREMPPLVQPLDASMVVIEFAEPPVIESSSSKLPESSVWHDMVHASVITPMGQTKVDDSTNCLAWGTYNFAKKQEEPTMITLSSEPSLLIENNEEDASVLPETITTTITQEDASLCNIEVSISEVVEAEVA